MKLCKDCKYFEGSNYCKSPSNGMSPVTGLPEIRFASTNRKPKTLPLETATIKEFGCGPDATFFEERVIELKRPWYKFWR